MGISEGDVVAHRYVLGPRLGAGGLGATFRARDDVMERDVALKIVRAASSPAFQTLRREFLTLRGLAHPHLARVHDFGVHRAAGRASAYYTAEIVAGVPLDAFARGRAWRDVAPAVGHVLGALAFLHARGVLHGDVTPGNVLVAAKGEGAVGVMGARATLLDLSCCRPLGDAPSGEIYGTRGYLAPEALRGEATPSVDLFALGVTLTRAVEALAEPPPANVLRCIAALTSVDARARPTTAEEAAERFGFAELPASAPARVASAFVGRSAELDVLRALAESVRQGDAVGAGGAQGVTHARTVNVYGEDGIGRSRVVTEAAWLAGGEVDVVVGNARHGDAVVAMVARAEGVPMPRDAGPASVVRGVDRLRARGAPVLFVVDDTHALRGDARAAFDALVRALGDSGCLGLFCAGREPVQGARNLALAPLRDADVAAWLGDAVATTAIPALLEVTAGLPGAIAALAATLSPGSSSAEAVRRAARREAARATSSTSHPELAPDLSRALALLVACEGVLDEAMFAAEGDDAALRVTEETRRRLADLGFLRRDGAVDRIALGLDPASLARLVGASAVRDAHAAIARASASVVSVADVAPRLYGAHVRHVAAAGNVDEALVLLRSRADLVRRAPHAFRGACEALTTREAARRVAPEIAYVVAQVFDGCGEHGLALATLARALLDRTRVGSAWRARLRRLAGACYARRGDARRAARMLTRALDGLDDARERREAAADLSLALLKLGDPTRAATVAQDALASLAASTDLVESDVWIGCDLRIDLAFARSYAGDAPGAREALRAATQTAESAVAAPPRTLQRLASAAGFVAFRAGDPVASAAAYGRALALAEASSLDDLIASAALNAGTASHQLGDLGPAIAGYERGLRMAGALAMSSTEAMLAFNLAKAFADAGLFERSARRSAHAKALSAQGSLHFLGGAVAALDADVAFLRGRVAESRQLLAEARRVFEAEGAGRELVEVAVAESEIDVAEGSPDAAMERLANLTASLPDGAFSARDTTARLALARGAALTAQRRSGDAIRELDEAARLAEATSMTLLRADVEGALAGAHAAGVSQASRLAAATHRARQREHLERTLATLPSTFHDAFRAHPRHAVAFAASAEAVDAVTAPSMAASKHAREVHDLRRLLEINRRLNSAFTTDDVLAAAMDAAVDLTRAERGFVLLRERGARESKLRVAVARNVDREKVGRSHLKFSRGIAERAIRSGEPVIAVDAASDARFASNTSVHAMRLTSVLCVPVRSPSGVLGALYLDNRFRIGGFDTDDVATLLAFSDQVALALEKARLHDELTEKTRALEASQRELERLTRAQADEIEQLRATDAASAAMGATASPRGRHRYAHAGILGQSAAMARVFDVLDRIAGADVTVLIRGESGTGKELVARALHDGSERRAKPFVAVNCGALPEALLEGELFGYRRGAFTGATRDHDGLFVAADGGTLFLDELGEMTSAMQVKLLRVLQEREVTPLGGGALRSVDVRVVCATNRPLRDDVRAGRFREDLFYRLAVVELELPPLRDRVEDIPALAEASLARFADETKRPRVRLDRSAERALMANAWPGNVRQLQNVLMRALLMHDGPTLSARDVALGEAQGHTHAHAHGDAVGGSPKRGYRPDEAARMRATLHACGWNVTEAARVLGIPRASFYRKLARYGIEGPGE